jgi:hypothetical protein
LDCKGLLLLLLLALDACSSGVFFVKITFESDTMLFSIKVLCEVNRFSQSFICFVPQSNKNTPKKKMFE